MWDWAIVGFGCGVCVAANGAFGWTVVVCGACLVLAVHLW